MPARPHLLGVDDAPFTKHQKTDVPLVGVMMEGATLVEGVAVGAFPVDGPDATGYLARWIGSHRWHAALQGVLLGGITIAGLGVVDLAALSEALGVPVIAATRRTTAGSTLAAALRAAGLTDRLPVVESTPPSRRVEPGLHIACAGIGHPEAATLVRGSLNKARVPEPLRVAHLIGAAVVSGASRGRP